MEEWPKNGKGPGSFIFEQERDGPFVPIQSYVGNSTVTRILISEVGNSSAPPMTTTVTGHQMDVGEWPNFEMVKSTWLDW